MLKDIELMPCIVPIGTKKKKGGYNMAKKKKVDEVLKEEVINEEEKDNEIEESEEETKEEEQTEVSDDNVVEEEKDEEEEEIEIISLDNQPVSPIIAEEESEEVPRNFVPAKPNKKNGKKTPKHLIHNGRVYKVLNNGRGMYADTGETFDLREVK